MKATTQHIEKTDISVVIVNYKSWKHLKTCLESLKKVSQDDFKLEVVVVDNQSNDGKLDGFVQQFPQFRFLKNSGNNGFSNGCNLGANQSAGEYLLFLNPDTIVKKEALLEMLHVARANPGYGIVSCAKVNLEGKPEKEIRFFPKPATLLGFLRAIYKLVHSAKISDKYKAEKNIVFPDWVSGSIILTSRKWYQKVNGWNEDYWLYLEDVDFCKKITKSGGTVALTRTAKIVHNHGGASRINVNTAALTKAEVITSKHVYIQNHFGNPKKHAMHLALLLYSLLSKFLQAAIGAIFFFVPKLYVNVLIFLNLIKYYLNALIKNTWISKRSPNYIK